MSDNKSCGTTDCGHYNQNMPTNCERSKKPNKSFCQKFTEEVRQTMIDKPELKPRGIGYKITNNPREDFPNHIWEIAYGCHVNNWETDRLLDFIDAIPPEILKRADLAKPSEWIERKARAFDWFVKEMMDEELEILMEKGGYKTPLEAIEKAMIPPTRETP